MSKFNLKDYQKTNGDEHINMRLEKQRSEAPDVINEKQLEDYRATESDVTIEKQLEEARTGEETETTEKRLDTHKPKFANKYRNPEAYQGDMNKLEEQRLQGDTNEKEKYEAASETPKQFRWWEGVKSPDGLKLASDTKKVVIARDEYDEREENIEEMSFDKPRFQEATEPEEEVMTEKEPKVMTDFPVEKVDSIYGADRGNFEIETDKKLDSPHLKGHYMILSFDPESFKGNEESIKRSALEKIISVHPELDGYISMDDLGDIKDLGGRGTIKLRSTEPIINNVSKGTKPSTIESEENEGDPIIEDNYKEKVIDGTPMATGKVSINTEINPDNKDQVINDVISFLRLKHPRIQIEKDSLDLVDLERGEVRYMVGINDISKPSELSLEEEFKKMEEPMADDPEVEAELAEIQENLAKDPNYYEDKDEDFDIVDETPATPEVPYEPSTDKKYPLLPPVAKTNSGINVESASKKK